MSKNVGASITKSAMRYLLGETSYVDDVKVPNALHCSFVRSPYAHAKIKGLHAGRALSLPGVVAVIAGHEVKENTRAIWQDFPPPAKYKRLAQQWLPTDVVRHAGEAVAAVIAERKEVAEDATELVEVEYEPLEAIVDAEKGLDGKGPFLYPEWGTNVWAEWSIGGGDVDSAFAKSDVTVRRRFVVHRSTGAPIEPGGTVAYYDALTDRLTVWMSKQDPFVQRDSLADALGLSESRIRVLSIDVGGGFGTKLNHYSEDVVVSYAAMKLRRPIRWIITRREHFLSIHQSREMVHYIELAAKRDGTIVGLKGKLIGNVGVAHKGQWYHSGPLTCLACAVGINGLYDIKNIKYDIRCVVTNTAPEGAVRGFGFQEGTFVLERSIDILAKELRMDPSRIRERNLIGNFPYKSITGQLYDSGDYQALLKKTLEVSSYHDFLKKKGETRNGKRLGVGLVLYGKGTAPVIMYGASPAAHEMVTVELAEDGKPLVRTGSANIGTHITTTLAQILANELGLDMDEVVVLNGDTDNSPFSLGPFGSRMAITAGSATLLAAKKLKEKILEIAAQLLEASKLDLELVGGKVGVKGAPRKELSLKQVAQVAYVDIKKLPEGMVPTLSITESFFPPAIKFGEPNIYGGYSSGAMVAVVEVDMETGVVDLLKCVHVHDSGKVLSPAIVHDQAVGGIAQGIGAALYEEIVYDEAGQLLSGTFMDYLIPSAREVPREIEVHELESPSPYNPLGAKGVGESPIIPPPAAIANAVADALSDLGIEVTEYPLTPERLWRMIKNPQGKS